MISSAVKMSEEGQEDVSYGIVIVEDDKTSIEELSGWIVSTAVYMLMLTSALLMLTSIKVSLKKDCLKVITFNTLFQHGQLAHRINILFNVICLLSSIIATLVTITLDNPDVIVGLNSYAGFLALLALLQSVRTR